MSEKNKFGLSRDIPEDVKRQIRQACGFGCVYCGLAIATYEHIDPEFNEATSHDPEKMAYLCGNCHDRVTRKFWSKQKIKQARENPLCIRNGRCHDALDISEEKDLVLWLGSTRIVGMETIFKVDDTTLLSIEPPEQAGAPYRLSGEFYDDEGNLLFRIAKNEWFGESKNWDIECVGGRIIIRTKPRNISLQILCNPPNEVIIEKLNMLYKDTRFYLDSFYRLHCKSYEGGGFSMFGRELVATSRGAVAFTAISKENPHKINESGTSSLGGGGDFYIGTVNYSDIPKSISDDTTRQWKRLGVNDPCLCGSGRKYKKCHDTDKS